MSKNCSIIISTTQPDVSDEPLTETAWGVMKQNGGITCISYEMPGSDGRDAISSRLLIKDGRLEVRRSGGINGTLHFISGKSCTSQIDLGGMCLLVRNETESLKLIETDGGILIHVRYRSYLNDEFISVCEMEIIVRI